MVEDRLAREKVVESDREAVRQVDCGDLSQNPETIAHRQPSPADRLGPRETTKPTPPVGEQYVRLDAATIIRQVRI
jgi:hypothetical protein